jgi:sugar phosphate isomerase/epimerase
MKRKILNCISTIDEISIEDYARLGIGVEIQDFTEPNFSDEEIGQLVRRYKDLFKGVRLQKSMHGPFLDLKPSSPDLRIRAISQKRYLKALEIAAELDMDYIVFHSQIDPNLNEPNLARLNNSQSRDAWADLVRSASNFQGTIVIENVFEKTPAMLKALIETIDQPRVKINLDVGHCLLGQATLEDWISALRDHIAYIHLHTNNGIHDQHQKVTIKEFQQLDQLLERYQLDPAIALEYPVTDLEQEVLALRL